VSQPLDDGYVTCPRCKGDGQVFAYTDLPSMGQGARGEYFACPLCTGVGTIEADAAAQWREDNADEADEC
jgi:DnaJ-class molecular chaperone